MALLSFIEKEYAITLTSNSSQYIREIKELFPQYEQLQGYVIQAQRNYTQASYAPLSPEEVIAILDTESDIHEQLEQIKLMLTEGLIAEYKIKNTVHAISRALHQLTNEVEDIAEYTRTELAEVLQKINSTTDSKTAFEISIPIIPLILTLKSHIEVDIPNQIRKLKS